MAVPRKTAEYLEQVLPEYRGNPLIEALPDILSSEEAMHLLRRRARYDEAERSLAAKKRIALVQPMIEAIRSNDRKRIEQYADITSIILDQFDWEHPVTDAGTVSGNTKVSAEKALLRLHESGLPVTETNYQLFPASYVLLHIPDTDRDHSGNIFEKEFIQVAEDTEWLLENGFQLPDNPGLRAAFRETAGMELDEHTVYPAGTGRETRFEHYLAARFLKESGRQRIGHMAQKCLSTIMTVDRIFGSFEDFWCSCRL